MAFTTTAVGDSGVSDTYNIDWSVGLIGSNRQEDVMLLQALFRIFYYEMMGFNGDMDPPPGETGVIVVDGYIGPVTLRHITHFQSQAVARGANVRRDGSVDPFRRQAELSHISRSRYTLELLNNACHNTCKDNNADNYSNLPNREDMPIELRNALRTRKDVAKQYQYGG
jgi:hypothetical protein